MKHRAVITTATGSTYIWSPGREQFWKVDGSIEMMDVSFSGRIVTGERLVMRGSMWDEARRRWVDYSKLTTSPVVAVEWELDWSVVPGTRGPVRTFVPAGINMEVV